MTTANIVAVTNKDFGYTVKFLRKFGYTFDAATKTWSGSRDIGFLLDEGYVRDAKPAPEPLPWASMIS